MARRVTPSKGKAVEETPPASLPKRVIRPTARKHPVASTREGKRNLTAYVPEEAFRQFKILAVKEDTTVQDLLVEGVNAVFQARGLPKLA